MPETAGYNTLGTLGYNDQDDRGTAASQMGCNLPLVDLGNYPTVAVIAGKLHACGLLQLCDTVQLKCWGATLPPFCPCHILPHWQAGRLELVPGGVLTPMSLAPGYNGMGQLGYGDKFHRGDGKYHTDQVLGAEMGRALPFVNLGIGKSVAFAAAGMGHTCAALRTIPEEKINELKCWGMPSPSNNPPARPHGTLQACTLPQTRVERGGFVFEHSRGGWWLLATSLLRSTLHAEPREPHEPYAREHRSQPVWPTRPGRLPAAPASRDLAIDQHR